MRRCIIAVAVGKAYACGILDLLLLINISANQLIMIIISDAVATHLKDGNQQQY
jgi:hypothetical protein